MFGSKFWLTKIASQELSAIVPFKPDQSIPNILNDGKTASFPFLTFAVHLIKIPNNIKKVMVAIVQKPPILLFV